MLTTYYQDCFCVSWELELRLRNERPTKELFGLRTITHPSCLCPITPYLPFSPSPHCQRQCSSWINRLPILIKERDIVERTEETTFCSQLTLPIFYVTQTVFFGPFLTAGPLLRRITVFQVLSPQVTKLHTFISNLYYFMYLSG